MPETLLVSRRRRRGGRLAHSIVCATRGRCCRTYRLRHHLNKAKATERPSLGSSEGRGSGPDFSASLAELTAAFDAKVFSSTTHSDAALNALEELGKLVPRGNLGHCAEGGAPVSTYVEGHAEGDHVGSHHIQCVTVAGASGGGVAQWCMIQARHNIFCLEPPLCKPREFTTWKR